MWEFANGTGQTVRAAHLPERVVAYVRAGAALHDLGVCPVAVYGSAHDADGLDPAKAGALPASAVRYLGPGRELTERELRSVRPDLIVDVTYDDENAYALDDALARRLGVPLLALPVGGGPLTAIVERFGALATALRPGRADDGGGGEPASRAGRAPGSGPVAGAGPAAGTGLVEAERALRAVTAGDPAPPRVLALSGAGPDQVHLARPEAWPELRRLAELGVGLADPGPGGGISWLTTDWETVARLRPDLLLVDNRTNAVGPGDLETGPAWRALAPDAPAEPWNPETPPSPRAYGDFFRAVAGALEALRAKR
ncbi:ABC transporter substrate-binding protein [Streptomyces sp. SP18CS02]|uniref:ABC transporter substrate-binding protein n=1 Tax=Streptomyces sp. SP18CS02 TaxID=3002531 RepID=UPI002E782FD0|nr:ABC transporter substrate-binding protein [Streptomyces sp. SP18CS02]MEE1751873.1 ABC transporter substrate-binding protein [Streptomyces sp. SP18CS02]